MRPATGPVDARSDESATAGGLARVERWLPHAAAAQPTPSPAPGADPLPLAGVAQGARSRCSREPRAPRRSSRRARWSVSRRPTGATAPASRRRCPPAAAPRADARGELAQRPPTHVPSARGGRRPSRPAGWAAARGRAHALALGTAVHFVLERCRLKTTASPRRARRAGGRPGGPARRRRARRGPGSRLLAGGAAARRRPQRPPPRAARLRLSRRRADRGRHRPHLPRRPARRLGRGRLQDRRPAAAPMPCAPSYGGHRRALMPSPSRPPAAGPWSPCAVLLAALPDAAGAATVVRPARRPGPCATLVESRLRDGGGTGRVAARQGHVPGRSKETAIWLTSDQARQGVTGSTCRSASDIRALRAKILGGVLLAAVLALGAQFAISYSSAANSIDRLEASRVAATDRGRRCPRRPSRGARTAGGRRCFAPGRPARRRAATGRGCVKRWSTVSWAAHRVDLHRRARQARLRPWRVRPGSRPAAVRPPILRSAALGLGGLGMGGLEGRSSGLWPRLRSSSTAPGAARPVRSSSPTRSTAGSWRRSSAPRALCIAFLLGRPGRRRHRSRDPAARGEHRGPPAGRGAVHAAQGYRATAWRCRGGRAGEHGRRRGAHADPRDRALPATRHAARGPWSDGGRRLIGSILSRPAGQAARLADGRGARARRGRPAAPRDRLLAQTRRDQRSRPGFQRHGGAGRRRPGGAATGGHARRPYRAAQPARVLPSPAPRSSPEPTAAARLCRC